MLSDAMGGSYTLAVLRQGLRGREVELIAEHRCLSYQRLYPDCLFTNSLNSLPTLKCGSLLGVTSTTFPVLGLRPL